MEIKAFRDFLKKQGKPQSAIDRCVELTAEFEACLCKNLHKGLDDADPSDFEAFASNIQVESQPIPIFGLYIVITHTVETKACVALPQIGVND